MNWNWTPWGAIYGLDIIVASLLTRWLKDDSDRWDALAVVAVIWGLKLIFQLQRTAVAKLAWLMDGEAMAKNYADHLRKISIPRPESDTRLKEYLRGVSRIEGEDAAIEAAIELGNLEGGLDAARLEKVMLFEKVADRGFELFCHPGRARPEAFFAKHGDKIMAAAFLASLAFAVWG